MSKVKNLFSFVLIVLLFIGPIKAQQCTSGCSRALPTKVVPKVDSTYVYELQAKTVLTPRDTQKVTIKADAEVGIQSSCEAILKLKNVVIEGVPDGADLAAQVAINPTTFGYFDGQIRGFCPTKDEEEWVVNIKKAIVSALQISSTGEENDDVIEEDFSGSCPTSFRNIEKTDSGMVIEKKKNLNRCKDRRVDLRQTPDQALGQLKELLRQYAHPMDSRLTCKLTLKDKVVSEVDCEESHTIMHRQDKPLHVSNIKLSLKDTKAGITTDLAAREFDKQEIFFQHDHKHKHTSSEADIVETLKKLCQEISGKNIHIEASTTFEDLTSKLKYAADDVVSSVDEAVKSGSICPSANKRLRELFLDASAFAASDGSIKTLVNAHNNNELSISRATAAFMVVALKAAPKEDTIQALIPLIHSEKSTRPLLLGLSVLFRRYCQKTNDCASNAAVKEARDAFVDRIVRNENKLEKITLIKALENLDVNKENNENVVNILDEIINSESANEGVRLAALKALPDEESINEQLKSIVLKESNSNEVRIAAFQKLVRNNGVKNIGDLVGVKENCVKNYILSFVKNIKKSKNPLRRKLLPDDVNVSEEPNTKFGITKNVAHEFGALTLEFDVIYPKDSNVTRAINTRVSRSVDGKYVEVVEIGLRHEGLDKNVGNILNLISRKVSPSEFGFEAVRHLAELLSKLKKNDPTFNSLQVSVKVNGKNLVFTDVFKDIHAMTGLLKKRFKKIIEEKGGDRTIGGVFVDTKLIVSTISGIPLIYQLNDNFVFQINGQVTGDSKKQNIVLNRSLIAGLQASIQLKLKNNKMGYEYDAKLAVTPLLDLDVERNEKSIVLRADIKDFDSHTFFKFKQSFREKLSGSQFPIKSDIELPAEPRADNCFTPFILSYCRRLSFVDGLILPNVEYYVTKPDLDIAALELEVKLVNTIADTLIVIGTYKAVNSSKHTEHSIEIDFNIFTNPLKEIKVLLKSPTNQTEAKISYSLSSTLSEFNLNFPYGKFEMQFNKLEMSYKLNGELNICGKEYAYSDEFKKIGNQLFEGKILVQTDKDKKMFINHIDKIGNNWNSTKLDANISFSDMPQKYHIQINGEYHNSLNFKVEGNEHSLLKTFIFYSTIWDQYKTSRFKIDIPKLNLIYSLDRDTPESNHRIVKNHVKLGRFEHEMELDISKGGSFAKFRRFSPEQETVNCSFIGGEINIDIATENVDAKVEGDLNSGKIYLQNVNSQYELIGTYLREGYKLTIEPNSSSDISNLRALFAITEPSLFVFESPKVNMHLNFDLTKPRKTFHFDFDNARFDSKIDAEYETDVNFKYSGLANFNSSTKVNKVEIFHVPFKELHMDFDLDYEGVKFKLDKSQFDDIVRIEYGLNGESNNAVLNLGIFRPIVLYLIRLYKGH